MSSFSNDSAEESPENRINELLQGLQSKYQQLPLPLQEGKCFEDKIYIPQPVNAYLLLIK